MTTLFDTVARARRTDPRSSHEAARGMNQSGAVGTHNAIIVDGIKRHPGLTASELACHIPLTDVQIRKRVPDLARQGGPIMYGRHRRSNRTGRLEQTYWPPVET